jgi:transposase
MANVLKTEKREQVVALGRLGWSLRRIESETGVRRETASAVLRGAGINIRPVGRWGRPQQATAGVAEPIGPVAPPPPLEPPKPANENQVSTDSGAPAAGPVPGPHTSHSEMHRGFIEESMDKRRNAVAIYQDLVDGYGFTASYKSVARLVARLRKARGEQDGPCGVIETAPGEELQVDWGEGPMVRYPETGDYRRVRLFVLTLGYSRKSVRLLSFHSSSRIWAELHEQAFRRLGGVTNVAVLDNLKEGVLKADIWDPTLNPLYAAVLKHYGVVGHACRVRDPDRKGKVERAVGHAQGTPLKGLRFETLADAQAHLDRWEERWADTRIHGTTKKQVLAMFNVEKPHLKTLPVEPFRYFEYGTRTVHSIDGCVQVGAAWYEAPPGFLGQEMPVQWDDHRVRIMSPTDGNLLLVEHPRKEPGKHSLVFAQPSRTPPKVAALLTRAGNAGKNIGVLCQSIHGHENVAGVRRIQGVLGLARSHGAARVDEVCRLALEVGVPTYKFVKRFIEHHPPTQLVAKMDPIIRDLTEYRDIIRRMTGETP